MTYTKAIAIETVYLRINNGQTKTENLVKREDVQPYLLAAIAWAWSIELSERQQKAIQSKRFGIQNEMSFNDLRITQYLTPTLDTRKNEYYVTVSVPTVSGIQHIEVNHTKGFSKIQSIAKRTDLVGMEDSISGLEFVYFLPKTATQAARLYFIGLDECCGDEELEIITNIDFSTLGDDDILPIPDGKQVSVIDKCVQFFLGQKDGEDNLIDENDKLSANDKNIVR